jgi:hypothetical protein
MQAPIDAHARVSEAYVPADESRSIGSEGLAYAENGHDRRRYDCVRRCSARLLAGIERRPAESILQDSFGEVHHSMPETGAGAIVFEENKVLLIQWQDRGLWCMLGGSVEVGETLAEVAE